MEPATDDMTEAEARRLATARIARLAAEAAECGACLSAFFFHFGGQAAIDADVNNRLAPPGERRKSAFVYDMQ
jgi:hypothetical protein